jgi:hypothetical protein
MHWQFHFIIKAFAGGESQVDVELLTIPEHLSTLPVYCGVRFARSLVFCVVFCRSLNPVISHEKERTGKRLRQVEHIRSHL